MVDAGATSRLALPIPGATSASRHGLRATQANAARSAMSLPVPAVARSRSYLDYDASAWPNWKQRWLVFDSDAQQDEYRTDRMIPAYFKLFGISSLLTALVIAIDMAREVSMDTATPARIAVSSLAIAAYIAVVIHTTIIGPSAPGKKRRTRSFLFRHGLDLWFVAAMLLTCLPEYLNPTRIVVPPSTVGGYIPAFFILVIADYTGNGLLFPWNVLLAGIAIVLQLSFSIWASTAAPWQIYTHMSPIIAALLIAFPFYYINDRMQRISYLNWNRLEKERTESVEAKSRLDNQLTLMFPQAILPALRADFESGNHGVIAKSIKSAAVMFVEFGGKQLKSHMLSTNVEQAAKAVKVLNCIFGEVDNLLANSEFHQIHKIKTLGSKVLLAGGLFSSWSKASAEPAPQRRESLAPRIIPDLVKFLHVLYRKLYHMNVEIVDLLDIKAGMHIGPLVVGIVGNTRFYFDVYGDTINCSSRMMDLAKPGELAFGEIVWNSLQPVMLNCRCLGTQQIKGKGLMEVYVSDIENGEQAGPTLLIPKVPASSPSSPTTGHTDRTALSVTFSDDQPEGFRRLSIMVRRFSVSTRSHVFQLGHRLRILAYGFAKRARKFFTFHVDTWADSKAAYTAETIVKMQADQYVGHLGSYLRRIPSSMARKVLFAEMNGWLLRFRNEDLERIYRTSKVHSSHRAIFFTCTMGIAASLSQALAALTHALGNPSTFTKLSQARDSGRLFSAEGYALVWVILGACLQLCGLLGIWTGVEAEKLMPEALAGTDLANLSRGPAEWTPSGQQTIPDPMGSLEKINREQKVLSAVRGIVLFCAALGFTLVHVGSLLLTDLDDQYGYVAATMQLAAFFTVTIPISGGWIFGESQILLAYFLVGGSLAWIACFGRVEVYEGVQAVLLASVSVVTSMINKQVEREDFLMRLVTAKHSLMTSFENERALKFLECLVPAHIVPYLLSVPRKDIVERLDMETVMFMDICGFTKISSLMEPYAVIRMLNAIFYEFDQIIQATDGRMQKITTIGDAYLACTMTRKALATPKNSFADGINGDQLGGSSSHPAPPLTPAAESALLCCQTALAMQEKLVELHSFPWFRSMLRGNTVVIRIGVHTTDVLGTVLGSRYELVGNGVFAAEKVQEGCRPGGVAVSCKTLEVLGGEEAVEKRGWKVEGNGKFVALGDAIRVVETRPADGGEVLECFDLAKK